MPAAETTAEGEGEDAVDATYTAMQTLLESVQDQTWLYLKTHVKLKYRADDNDIRSRTTRNRMPWQAYTGI